jgi:hypothetical protein
VLTLNAISKWAERLYSETDFGRSVATSAAGVVGLVVYLAFRDWVIAAFATIISFPIIRLVAARLNEKAMLRAKRRNVREEAEHLYECLSREEKLVVEAFVRAGGSVLTWSQMNRLSLPGPAIESLIQREVLWTSTTADAITETFVLDTSIFDVCRDRSQVDGQRT